MDFREVQKQFAAHIRDPEMNSAPEDVPDQRMKIYRELFYNNIESFLKTCFRLVAELLGESRWHQLVRQFYSQHACKTPLFLEIHQEFLQYLQSSSRPTLEKEPEFLLELAHYEWMELTLDIAEDELPDDVAFDGDLMLDTLVLSPLMSVLSYRYPVHRIGPKFQPETPPSEPTFLVVYRNKSDSVGFMEINSLTARLLNIMQEDQSITGRQLIEKLSLEYPQYGLSNVEKGVQDTLGHLRNKEIILGVRVKTT